MKSSTRRNIPKYTALVIQPHVNVAENREDIKGNLERVCNLIDFGVGYFWELPARLVVLPEYFLQGVTTPGKGEHGIDSFMKKAIELDGPELKRLGEKAREYNLYIAGGGVVEKVPHFPDRWFNTAFIIGPSGKVILRYHKWHIPASIGLGTSPHDMLDEYRAAFGADIKDLFPVVDTEIGKLGTMTCHDGCTPGGLACARLQRLRGDLPPGGAAGGRGRERAVGLLALHAPHPRARQHGLPAGFQLGHRRLRLLPARLLPGQLHHHRLPGHGAARGRRTRRSR